MRRPRRNLVQGELSKGNQPATVNRHLATVRSLLRMARDAWQWIDSFPKVRMLGGKVERDRWLSREEADKLIAACPDYLAALVRFALATGFVMRLSFWKGSKENTPATALLWMADRFAGRSATRLGGLH